MVIGNYNVIMSTEHDKINKEFGFNVKSMREASHISNAFNDRPNVYVNIYPALWREFFLCLLRVRILSYY